MRSSIIATVLVLLISTASLAGPLGDAAKKGDVAEIERLLGSGADVNEPGAMVSPLHWAAMNGHPHAVRLLASHGAALDAQSSLGSPLHAAAQFNRVEAVRALLEAGADPDVRDRDEFTPLMRAAVANRVMVVEVLVAGGADVNAVGISPGPGGDMGWGLTIALQLARRSGHDQVVDALIAGGAGPIPPEVPIDIATRGDPTRGRELAYSFCRECHAIEAGDEQPFGNAAGPPLIGIIGQPVADMSGFEYSEALTAHGGTWTPDRLYPFALRPTLTVPGTRMNVRSAEPEPEAAADITAYFLSVAE